MHIKGFCRTTAFAAAGLAGMVAAPANATTGYFTNGVSVQAKGMAGTGTAIGTGFMGAAHNPAMGTRYPDQGEACLTFFSPDRSVEFGGGTFKSENEFFIIPCGGGNFGIRPDTTVGFLMYGNGGMNTEYTTNFLSFGGGTSPLGVNLEQLFVSVNVAHQVNERLSIGIAPTLAVQRFSATGLEDFAGFSLDPTALTNNGDDWSHGFGLGLGVLWQATPNLTLGAAYRTEMQMGAFDKYAGLFAEGGDFDIPATLSLGAAYTPPSNPDLTLSGEVQRIFYSDVAAIANPSAPPGGPLGSPTGIGFGWKDMDVVRVAAEYRVNPKWTVRGGLSYNTEFTEPAEAVINTLAPATPQWHASIGASYAWDENKVIHVAYTHALDNDLEGANPALTGPAVARIRMSQNELSVGMSWKF